MSTSRPMRYFFFLTFARILLLFLKLTLQQETRIFIKLHNLHTLFVQFLSLFDYHFILIGHSKASFTLASFS